MWPFEGCCCAESKRKEDDAITPPRRQSLLGIVEDSFQDLPTPSPRERVSKSGAIHSSRAPESSVFIGTPTNRQMERQPVKGYHIDTPMKQAKYSSLSAEEREQEKNRLQVLVREFAKEAVVGFDVVLINPDNGDKIDARFTMDRHLTKFYMSGLNDTYDLPSSDISMPDVRSVFKVSDVRHKFPDFPLEPSEMTKIVAIEVSSGSCTTGMFSLLFYFLSRPSRDKFYNCMKILRLSVELKR